MSHCPSSTVGAVALPAVLLVALAKIRKREE